MPNTIYIECPSWDNLADLAGVIIENLNTNTEAK